MRLAILIGVVVFGQVSCGTSGSPSAPAAPTAPAGWQRHAADPLLTPTLTASTIQWAIADPSVLHDPSDGLWKLWYSTAYEDRGTHVQKVVIRYAESVDGVAWTTQAAPALDTHAIATDWDYTHVETPSVIIDTRPATPAAQRYVLFYSGANVDAQAGMGRPTSTPYYQIGIAFSADGKSFTRSSPGVGGKPGLVLAPSAGFFGGLPSYADGVLADPEVALKAGVLHLWCTSYAETSARAPLAFGVSHAVSSDFGRTWTIPNANPLASLYKPGDLGGAAQPSVIYDAGLDRFEMWFTNDTAAESASIPATSFTALGFWHATSSDGIAWTPDYSTRDLPWIPGNDYESLGLITGVEVVRDGGVDRAWFSAWGSHGNPDPSIYVTPVHAGGTVPAVITLGLATKASPLVASGMRQRVVSTLADASIAQGTSVPP